VREEVSSFFEPEELDAIAALSPAGNNLVFRSDGS
jgi:hypothetical protein